MSQTRLTRRDLLKRGAALTACSAAAHPLLSTVTFASAPGADRLVVIILRGAMDGLDVLRPVGDPAYAALRPAILRNEPEPTVMLDGFFALHPALRPLMPLWVAGELGFAHAVSTPDRAKRSHFDGQDILEAGTGLDVPSGQARDGWLNRLLQALPQMESRTAFAIGNEPLRILAGTAPVSHWSPSVALKLTPQAELLLTEVYREDPLFAGSINQAIALAQLAAPDAIDPRGAALLARMETGRRGGPQALAAFAAERLYHEARIAAFSLSGWDTHKRQAQGIRGVLGDLVDAILTLRTGLGEAWSRTTILAMTEFGRTAHENGSQGTDHGTGGAMLFAGGAVRGGRVLGRWPGLAEADLLDRRDLMPTGDVRGHAAWAMHGMFGIERGVLERTVFPGLEMGANPGLIR